MNGIQNTAYSRFYIEQLNQTDKIRMALLKTNDIFDYDAPGMIKKTSNVLCIYPTRDEDFF